MTEEGIAIKEVIKDFGEKYRHFLEWCSAEVAEQLIKLKVPLKDEGDVCDAIEVYSGVDSSFFEKYFGNAGEAVMWDLLEDIVFCGE